jgi:acetyl esterase
MTHSLLLGTILHSTPSAAASHVSVVRRKVGDHPIPGRRKRPSILCSTTSRRHIAGNLTLATGLKLLKDGDIGFIRGLYALCPYIAGEWPLPQNPSSMENEGILISVHHNRGAMGYGIAAFRARDPLAWPSFAKGEDVKGLPPVVISVNECDPLRDEGINFYRFLMQNGVPARCRQVMGTVHATEIFISCCPDISRDTARDIVNLAVG